MAIVPLTKVTIYGLLNEREKILGRLQSVGLMHVTSLRPDETKPAVPEISSDVHEALKYLTTCPIQQPTVGELVSFDLDTVVTETKALERRDFQSQDERDDLEKAIRTLEPWGEFRIPSTSELNGLSLWFYVLPAGRSDELLHAIQQPWEIIRADAKNTYAIVVSDAEPTSLATYRVDLDARPLSGLRTRLSKVSEELEQIKLQRASLTRWIFRIQQALAEADDRAQLLYVLHQTFEDDRVFAVQGWVPNKNVPALESLAHELHLAVTTQSPASDELPPTLLENHALLAGGEHCVTLYLVPGYRWWDPSATVLLSFTIFFSMILADAGYATLLGILLALFWSRLSTSLIRRSFRNMWLILTAGSLIYGVLVGSYFGLAPPADWPLARLKILDVADTSTMMKLSILIGAGHLILANLITAYRLRGTLKSLSPVGWATAIVGGVLFGFASYNAAPQSLSTPGVVMLVGGLCLVLLFSSDQPFPPRRFSHGLWRFVDGLKSLTSISAIFGDTMSYLRLFALGLSGAKLAETFNNLALDVSSSIKGLGIVLALVIILIGHTLNFILAIMGGVVHGLRLNFIEFFNWSATDEGYPFRAFAKKAGH